ncbi:Transcriptional regulator, contains XRE-family HTH domain [Caldanaerobius fijiensis DSM 17918]|uniref:Transcriptional regulator, contains XRE-family HTH domain n=1 Tax=Caldanaerobius fijiensis DSM 17918 TaxID=1121256 RepID=A0A1M4Z0F0_9THEO|nr:helix-turn-helix transcriptional regulator [Caldanaerobius fijiensis]SHF11428.1 Transcriptional regulator, contains XRE-family HTH domain [Caldanaerobius fijiensis DSM 17918]
MNIGEKIKKLRLQKMLTQEQLAYALGVSVQSVSRWESGVNYPDITMLPLIAKLFNVTTDYLLDVEGEKNTAKLLKTVETIEVQSKKEAEELLAKFKAERFPVLKDYSITESNGKYILELTKEFNVDLNNVKFDK